MVNATTQLGMENKVDYNGQMTGMPLRMEFVWVWIALHVLILIFALWGMVSKEKSASKKSVSRKIEPEKSNQKNGIEKIKPEETVSKNPAASKMRSACPSCGRIPKEGEKFCTRCGSKLQ